MPCRICGNPRYNGMIKWFVNPASPGNFCPECHDQLPPSIRRSPMPSTSSSVLVPPLVPSSLYEDARRNFVERSKIANVGGDVRALDSGLVRLTAAYYGASDRSAGEMEATGAPPDWPRLCESSLFSGHLITFNLSGKDITKPTILTLIESGRHPITFSVSQRPFGKGGCRYAFYFVYRSPAIPPENNRFVAKSMINLPIDKSRIALKDILLLHEISAIIIAAFNNALGHVTVQLSQTFLLEHTSGTYSLEPFMEGRWLKFNDNVGWASENHEVPQALSHFSHHFSHQTLVLVDLQGCVKSGLYTLSDPAFNSIKVQHFGLTDMGPKGIDDFFASHKCGSTCHNLNLPPSGLFLPSSSHSPSSASIDAMIAGIILGPSSFDLPRTPHCTCGAGTYSARHHLDCTMSLSLRPPR